MISFDTIHFHESTVTDLSMKGSSIFLDVEDVRIDSINMNVAVIFDGIKNLVIDGKPSASIFMEYEDGEILSIQRNVNDIVIVIQWNEFKFQRYLMKVYKFTCNNVQCEVTSSAA